MPLLKTRVNVTNDFPLITRQISALARDATAEAAREGATAAAGVASQRSRTGRMAGMRVHPPEGTPDGWQAGFTSPVHYAWFQNYGTLGSRRRKLKEPPRGNRTREPGTGVEPLRFLDAGRTVGRRVLLDTIRKRLPR